MYVLRSIASVIVQIVAIATFILAINGELGTVPAWIWIVGAVVVYLIASYREYKNDEAYNEERSARIAYYRKNI